jgi:8-oxo-dGTP pyrophosphatase MutT (NUDIX family)
VPSITDLLLTLDRLPYTEGITTAHAFARERGEASLDRESNIGHFTVGCLLLSADHQELLLMHHAKLGCWLQPGGHIEPADPTIEAAVHREVREETGQELASLIPLEIDIHELRCDGRAPVTHYDIRYCAVTRSRHPLVINEESTDLRWFPTAQLPPAPPSVARLVARSLEHVQVHR